MKKVYFLFVFLTAIALGSWAEGIIDQISLPSCSIFVAQNPFPAFGSEEWKNTDSLLYFQLKEPRLKEGQPNYDSIWAHLNEQYYFALYRLAPDSVMGAPFMNITWKDDSKTKVTSHSGNSNFPKMNELEVLCEDMKEDNLPSIVRVRARPFNYFPNQYYNGKKQTYNPDATGSYPSGHGYFRGLFGKCLEIIDPEHNEAIQAMMDEWLFCRLQKGAHWASDLPAGEKLGVMAFDSAMTVDAFRKLVFDARKELNNYRLTQTPSLSLPNEASDIDEGIEAYLEGLTSEPTDFVLHRTFYKDGYFNTLCLPFDLSTFEGTPLEGAEVFAFESATLSDDELELHLVPVAAIEAGKPYLIRWTSGKNVYSMTFPNVVIKAHEGEAVGTEGVKFVGTMGQSTLSAGNTETLFVGANNTLYWPEVDSTLKGFRAYFLVSGSVAPHSAPARFVIRNTPTTLQEATRDEPVRKCIENGQVLIIRNGVKYNAQGQTVK